MITRDDLPETPDWAWPMAARNEDAPRVAKCCGVIATDIVCETCRQYVRLSALGEN